MFSFGNVCTSYGMRGLGDLNLFPADTAFARQIEVLPNGALRTRLSNRVQTSSTAANIVGLTGGFVSEGVG